MEVHCRHATRHDLARITEIYNTVVVDSHISFDTDPHTVEERGAWFAEKSKDGFHQAWVAEAEGGVVGVAYSGPWRAKEAYSRSVETTIVLDPDWTGRGIGGLLLSALLESLEAAGVHRAIAVVALPNPPSIDLHLTLGYRSVGVLDEAGHKLGRWWSTEILEKRIG